MDGFAVRASDLTRLPRTLRLVREATAASEADRAVVIPADVEAMPAGQLVEFRPWRELP
jgi:molybdopterin biosynthesis enzyme